MNDKILFTSIFFGVFLALAIIFAFASKSKKRRRTKKAGALLCLGVALLSLVFGSFVVTSGITDATPETQLSSEEVDVYYLNRDISTEEYKAVQNGSAIAYNCVSENCWFTTNQQRVKVVYNNQNSNRS